MEKAATTNHANIKRIAITGPESTGKSTLTRQLADHYQTTWAPEYARDYVASLQRPYTLADIEEIAYQQLQQEERLARNGYSLFFCDTEFTVLRIWCEYVFQTCPPWLRELQETRVYDLILLLNIDLPWQADPLREYPDTQTRSELYDWFVGYLHHNPSPVKKIAGKGAERFNKAVACIETTLTS